MQPGRSATIPHEWNHNVDPEGGPVSLALHGTTADPDVRNPTARQRPDAIPLISVSPEQPD